MTESFLVIFSLGLLAGLLFSVPVAGPISILITSNALKGRLRFCLRSALGGAIVEVFYVFIAVYGLTSLYDYYHNAIPIILIVGAIFLIFIARKIYKTHLTIEDLERSTDEIDDEEKGGFRTGVILNFTNPSLFVGWFTSSFLLLTFASSIGLNTGGLDLLMYENVSTIEEISGQSIESLEKFENFNLDNLNSVSPDQVQIKKESLSSFVLSLTYASTVGIGSFLWFYLLAKFLIKYREKLNINWLNILIKSLSFFLIGIAIYLVYQGVVLLS